MRKVLIEMWVPDDADDSDILDSMQHEAVDIAEYSLSDELPDEDAEAIRNEVSVQRQDDAGPNSLPSYF